MRIGFILGKRCFTNIFTKKEDIAVVELASQLMIIAALFQLSDGIQVTALGCLRGIQDVKILHSYLYRLLGDYHSIRLLSYGSYEDGRFRNVDSSGNWTYHFCSAFGDKI